MEEFEKNDQRNKKKTSFGKKIEKFAKMILIAIVKQLFAIFVMLILIIGLLSYIFSQISQSINEQNINFKENMINAKNYGADVSKSLVLSFPAGISDSHSSVFDIFGTSSNRKLSLYEILQSIEMAKDDKSVRSIYINLDTSFASFEHTEELIAKINEFKSTGKKVYAYGHHLTLRNYQLASSADEIYMEPAASTFVNLTGYHAILPYYKELTDKLGIRYNVVHVGDYKSFGENMTRQEMSEEFHQEIVKIYENIYEDIFLQIAKQRNTSKENIENKVYSGNLVAKNSAHALEENIIDGVKKYDEFKKEFLNENKLVSIPTYLNQSYVKLKADKKYMDKIAVIYANGPIYMNDYRDDSMDDQSIMPKVIDDKLEKALSDSKVKGIVIRVNSPGGSALASEIIYNKIKKASEKKPIYISMGNVAASGGYYISAAAQRIYANNSTITGSIGVVSMFPNIEDLSNKIGINFETVSKGKYAGLYDITKNSTDEELSIIRSSMMEIYHEFKNRVSEGRGIDETALEKISQGKIWTGRTAKRIGLIDEVGGLEKAIEDLATSQNIKNYKIENIERKPGLKDYLNILKKGLVLTEVLAGENNSYDILLKYLDKKTFGKRAALYFPYYDMIEIN